MQSGALLALLVQSGALLALLVQSGALLALLVQSGALLALLVQSGELLALLVQTADCNGGFPKVSRCPCFEITSFIRKSAQLLDHFAPVKLRTCFKFYSKRAIN